ncbi:hypothetical protein [Hoeflea sp.]|uniref:hypothetical protein n=1 Tax=Hoeflea sp. TaxID=1940281 RepID=UPI003A9294B9
MSKSNLAIAEAGIQSAALSGSAKSFTSARPSNLLAPLHKPVWLVFALFVLLTTVMHFTSYVDYVGADNDDVLRLVQVRDLLSGQGWFDLTQTRLGLEGGTLMHWSRLIDLPIANLIMLFSLVMSPTLAEASALFVWPLLTVLPIFYALAFSGGILAGLSGRLIGLAMAFLFVLGFNRFQPGSIDHHNVQLALMAIMAACLILPQRPPLAHAIAGIAASLAIAIGAETTPHVAIVALIVAGQWLWLGEPVKAAAQAFALAMAATLTAAFFITVPPAQYGLVACDALSTGYYSLGVVGAGAFFLAVASTSRQSFAVRFAALGLVGIGTLGLAVTVAPQCLGNPLSTLDPLLVTMWLNNVTEAQSILGEIRVQPWAVAGFYAVPVLAMGLCVRRLMQGREIHAHGVLLALLLVSWAIALVQVRGAVFANLISAIPLASLVAELRTRSNADPKDLRKGLAFAGMAFASVPVVWALAGAVLSMGVDKITGTANAAEEEEISCTSGEALADLAREPTGVVAGPSNLGAHILRFTRHRVLSAPYHRNQGGMLTELHAAMAPPVDAVKFLRGAGVTVIAYCPSDPQIANVIKAAPDGLYAQLAKGQVPAWLEPVPGTLSKPLQLYRVAP